MTILLGFALLFMARIVLVPVDLSFASDMVRSQVAEVLPGWQISFTEASLSWDWTTVRPRLQMGDLKLIDRRDRLEAHIESMSMDLSRTMFVTAKIQPVNVDIIGARIQVTDLAGFSDQTNDNVFRYADSGVGLPGPEAVKPITEALSRFGRRILATQEHLDHVIFNRGHIGISTGEGKSGIGFSFANIDLVRRGNIFKLETQGAVDIEALPANITATATISPMEGLVSTKFSVDDFMVPELARALNLPEIVSFLDFPVSVTSAIEANSTDGLSTAAFDIEAGAGQLYHAYSYPTSPVISSMNLSISYDPVNKELRIDQGTINGEEDVDLSLTGLVYWQEGNDRPGVKFRVETPQAQLGQILAYWPILKSKKTGKPAVGRVWVETNMSEVNARDVVFDVEVAPDGTGAFDEGSPLELRFNFVDTTTQYLKTMPPVVNAAGFGRLNKYALYLTATGGTVEGMTVAGTEVTIDWSRRIHEQPRGEFLIKSKGSVGKILELLDYPPMMLTRKFGFDPKRLGGIADTVTWLSAPLIKNMPKGALEVRSIAHVTDVRVDDILGGDGMRDGVIRLEVDMDQLVAEGNGTVNGVPLYVNWTEDFAIGRTDSQADTTHMVIAGGMSPDDLKAFKIDISDFFDGKVNGEATFIGRALQFKEGHFAADASFAEIKVPQLAWKKQVGIAANVTGSVYFGDDGITITPLLLEGEGIDATATFSWPKSELAVGELQPFNIMFDASKLDNNSLSGTVSRDKVGHSQIDIIADQLDIGAYLAVSGLETDEFENAEQNKFSLDLNAEIKQGLMLNGERLHDLTIKTAFRDGEPKSANLRAVHPSGGTVTGVITEGTNGQENQIELTSPNGGALLRSFGLFAHGENGDLQYVGKTSGWGKAIRVTGEIKATKMDIVNSNAMADQVTDGVFTGLNEYLKEKTLLLQKAKIPFEYSKGLLDMDTLKANSSSVGLTMKGQYEPSTRRVNMNGVVIPAYGLNSLVSSIPILGTILTGGKGEGIFAVTYRIKGQGSEASFEVNPLSAITPGIFRSIFEGRKGKVSDVEDKESKMKEQENKPELDKEKGSN